ncbi:uncharacterized protein SCODWIG_03530 [Saccharomycodes ludwigii]|uniref:Phosphoribulokinase/uridine kinase domain-containing protein n=1 Tax=Saccharomycodes ludwigii TaxID=36035 RepID=A0A376BB10_9ASCO|nr:hypothetical protein SCDLUD_003614 [Saccharomycodes ludwigii]KAH3900621.1 hypothetical protein SCDLUD_003614 [Saccharomycodes ludwigii]SSD61769.1 uncharacterized protein SCODWIG_03530 [Saccharomycodes ludwigii]
MTKYFISIGGGHFSGIHAITKTIKHKLGKIFPNYKITIIDLDELRSNEPTTMTYTDKDIDFIKLYKSLTEPNDTIFDEAEIILICGVYALYNPDINRIADLKIFMDSDSDTRLINLIQRSRRSISSGNPNQTERENISKQDAIDLEKAVNLYLNHLRPEWSQYIEPSRSNADMIVPISVSKETMIINDDTGNSVGSNNTQEAACMIFVDGIVRIIEDNEGRRNNESNDSGDSSTGNHNNSILNKQRQSSMIFPKLDFQRERLLVEQSRYLDMS